jgi:hypothetical protein
MDFHSLASIRTIADAQDLVSKKQQACIGQPAYGDKCLAREKAWTSLVSVHPQCNPSITYIHGKGRTYPKPWDFEPQQNSAQSLDLPNHVARGRALKQERIIALQQPRPAAAIHAFAEDM